MLLHNSQLKRDFIYVGRRYNILCLIQFTIKGKEILITENIEIVLITGLT